MSLRPSFDDHLHGWRLCAGPDTLCELDYVSTDGFIRVFRILRKGDPGRLAAAFRILNDRASEPTGSYRFVNKVTGEAVEEQYFFFKAWSDETASIRDVRPFPKPEGGFRGKLKRILEYIRDWPPPRNR